MVRKEAPELMDELAMLRDRDEDVTVRAGAILAFCGLLIAAGLVLLAAEPSTALHVSPSSLAARLTALALPALFVSAALALTAIGRARPGALTAPEAFVMSYDRAIGGRERRAGLASLGCYAGGAAILAGFALAFLTSAF